MSKWKEDIEKIGQKAFGFGNAISLGGRIGNDDWGSAMDELLKIAHEMDEYIDQSPQGQASLSKGNSGEEAKIIRLENCDSCFYHDACNGGQTLGCQWTPKISEPEPSGRSEGSDKEKLEPVEYKCGHCGYEGPCYGIPTGHGVTAPFCYECRKNDKLTLKK